MWMPLGWVSASGAGGATASFELISTTVLGSSTASVTFNITGAQQAAYKHLQLRMTARTTEGANDSNTIMTFNGDTGSNYNTHFLQGNGTNVQSFPLGTASYFMFGKGAGSTSTASSFSAIVMDVLDAFSTTKNKTTRTFSGLSSSSTLVYLDSGLWMSTAAISSMTIAIGSGASYATGSRFSLYGVRG